MSKENKISNFVYFDRVWFDDIIDHDFDLELYYEYLEESNKKYLTKIKERNKNFAEANKNGTSKDDIPNIMEEGNSYMKLARLHLIHEPTNKYEVATMMIGQYIFSYCKRTSKEDFTKIIKFTTLERVFKLDEKQIGTLITRYGELYFLTAHSKKERVGRPKQVYYAKFDTSTFLEHMKQLGLEEEECEVTFDGNLW